MIFAAFRVNPRYRCILHEVGKKENKQGILCEIAISTVP
jgi:hypothetical protein